jgi:hypothetical protein
VALDVFRVMDDPGVADVARRRRPLPVQRSPIYLFTQLSDQAEWARGPLAGHDASSPA